MSKLFIIGIVASGKTTLAKKLSQDLNIPHYELDNIVHHKTNNGRYKRTTKEVLDVISAINDTGDWIFEGVYRESYHYLFDMADKIIFLDTPLWKRKFRIILRFIKQQLHVEKCEYKSDFAMLKLMFKWTSDFENKRPEFENMIKRYDNKLIILKNIKNIDLP